MNYLILDNEGSSFEHSSGPLDPKWKLYLVSYATATESGFFGVEYDGEPYSKAIANIQRLVDDADILVGFNFKFDLHGLRRYGINFRGKRIWDCQLVEYMLSGQTSTMPGLDESLAKYGLGSKDSNAVNAFWDAGADTSEIPFDVLSHYGLKDAELTRSLYLKQLEIVNDRSKAFRSLVSLSNCDELVTQEMEWNGILLDTVACGVESKKIEVEVSHIDKQLASHFGVDWINYDSPKQLSALLYGGTIVTKDKVQIGYYKTGQKIGQPKYRLVENKHEFRRLVEPPKGSELANGGWSTSEDTLRSVRPGGKQTSIALDLILRRSKLEKLRGTYYDGFPALLSGMGWTGGYLHGQINHCITRTGRLSSSKPNMQNMPPEIDRLLRSRWGTEGFLAQADAKGLEWVCIVYLAQDETGMEEIWNGVDQHLANQERFGLPEKRVAKFFVFRLIYGGTAWTYTQDPDFTGVSTSEKFWQKVMDEFYAKYTGIARVHREWVKTAVETGKLETPTGRWFPFELNQWGSAPRTIILNYPVQSLGADLMAIARVSLAKRMEKAGLKTLLVNTIHDSIVLDIYGEEWYTVKELMESVFADIPKNFEKLFGVKFNLPMKCEFKNLNDGEKVE